MNRTIYYSTPYDTLKNVGKYYNDFMELLPSDDCWAVFTDGDAMFTTYDYGHIVEAAIETYGEDYPLMTCVTNRLGRKEQTIAGTWNSDDMPFHRNIGETLKDDWLSEVDDITHWKPIGGVMLAINKGAWEKVGKFKEDGMLGVDNDIFTKIKQAGMRVGLMKGIYLYHWYRGGSNKKNPLF